jgi:quercetin 2,3-dioxygenase
MRACALVLARPCAFRLRPHALPCVQTNRATTRRTLHTISRVEMAPRTVEKVVFAREQSEGVGARVRRSIGNGVNVDPFLLLDEFKGKRPAGFPDHPHRGMMTVT